MFSHFPTINPNHMINLFSGESEKDQLEEVHWETLQSGARKTPSTTYWETFHI